MIDSSKVFLWPVIISIIGHAALIGLSGMLDMRETLRPAEIWTVQIANAEFKPKPLLTPQKAEEAGRKKIQKAAEQSSTPKGREETVNIGSTDAKYAAYLADVKKKILRIWKYPEAAYQNNEEGVVLIKISIAESGSLLQTTLVKSSGFSHLDYGTLSAVQAAAPFRPLPLQYDLSRLHIIASFNYQMKD